jgi:hypothetical protein
MFIAQWGEMASEFVPPRRHLQILGPEKITPSSFTHMMGAIRAFCLVLRFAFPFALGMPANGRL